MKGIATLFVLGLVAATTAAPSAQFFSNLFGQSDTTTTSTTSVDHFFGDSSEDVSHSSDEQFNTTHFVRGIRQVFHPQQPFGAQINGTNNESRVVRSAPGDPFGSADNETDYEYEDYESHPVSNSDSNTNTGVHTFYNFRPFIPNANTTEHDTQADGSRFVRSPQFFASHAAENTTPNSTENSSSTFFSSSDHESSRSDFPSAFSGPVVPVIRDLDSTTTTTSSSITTHSQGFRFRRSDTDDEESSEVTERPEEDDTYRPPLLSSSPQVNHQ